MTDFVDVGSGTRIRARDVARLTIRRELLRPIGSDPILDAWNDGLRGTYVVPASPAPALDRASATIDARVLSAAVGLTWSQLVSILATRMPDANIVRVQRVSLSDATDVGSEAERAEATDDQAPFGGGFLGRVRETVGVTLGSVGTTIRIVLVAAVVVGGVVLVQVTRER